MKKKLLFAVMVVLAAISFTTPGKLTAQEKPSAGTSNSFPDAMLMTLCAG